MAPRLIVTIDGPAGTGKSAASHMLAERLGIDCLDTGAMYRCVSVLALRTGADPSDPRDLMPLIEAHAIDFDWTADPPVVRIDSVPAEQDIRTADVGRTVSIVAAVPEVRKAMVQAQRDIAAEHPRLVSEGRDQGSVVFPDADVRFFLTAEPAVRARRRVAQLEARGWAVDAAAIRSEIEGRDAIDSTRTVGPLVCPEGAIEIDTTSLDLGEVVDALEREVRNRVGKAVAPPC
ncbi:MAG: (d)CMP kinase [Phycisphaerales bacterium]|jgi:cytidylate kinase|nr:(d)CMP kinase [Phycisphaerales bacterium]